MAKKVIAVLFGGQLSEHDVSRSELYYYFKNKSG